jgi:hypothetical protein
MINILSPILVQGIFASSILVCAMSANAALLGRDINGNPVSSSSLTSVFLYDTDLNITWLQDAGASSRDTWQGVNDWADNLTVGRFSDWRLPNAYDVGTANICTGYSCSSSELGHLWFIELGNVVGGGVNAGPFRDFKGVTNVSYPSYWTSTIYAPNPSFAWRFNTAVGYQGTDGTYAGDWGLAVRNGDVLLPVPEPYSGILMVAGTMLVGLRALQRTKSPTRGAG